MPNRRRTILIVEDDAPLREILQVLLEDYPHDFLFAENGRQALELDGADVLILGCMSLAFLRVERELAEATGVPVVNYLLAGERFLEALVAAVLHHSKRAYTRPPKLTAGWNVASLRLMKGAGPESL